MTQMAAAAMGYVLMTNMVSETPLQGYDASHLIDEIAFSFAPGCLAIDVVLEVGSDWRAFARKVEIRTGHLVPEIDKVIQCVSRALEGVEF